MTYLKDLWARLTVHWHAVVLAVVAALPSVLDWLGVVDLKPLLINLGLKESLAAFIVGVMPFVLAFVKPMLVVEPAEPK